MLSGPTTCFGTALSSDDQHCNGPVGDISPFIDCFDGQVMSWSIGICPDATLVNTMLDNTLGTLSTNDKPEIHSDQSGHYRWPGWLYRYNNICYCTLKMSPDLASLKCYSLRQYGTDAFPRVVRKEWHYSGWLSMLRLFAFLLARSAWNLRTWNPLISPVFYTGTWITLSFSIKLIVGMDKRDVCQLDRIYKGWVECMGKREECDMCQWARPISYAEKWY